MKKRLRSFLAGLSIIFGILILPGCVTQAISRTDLYREYFDTPAEPEAADISYEFANGTHVFRLSGGAYEMGYRYGEKAAELDIRGVYDEVFTNATRMLKEDIPAEYRSFISVDTVKSLLVDAWEILAEYTPEYCLKMLKGFAEGASLPLQDVHAMHAIPDFTETSCSALWATGTATANGESLQIRVLDYIMDLGIQKYPAVVFMDFEGGHTVANIGWLGLLGVISGMNDTGLAVSEMGYGNPDGESFHGIPMPFLLLDVLRWSSHPYEAAGIIRSNPRTNSYVYISGTADNGGLVFVTNSAEVMSFGPGSTDSPVVQLDDMLHAGHYQERMDQLVREHHGTISISWLERDFIPRIAMDSNLQCVIYDLDNLRFYVSNAPDAEHRAADQQYSEFSF